MAPPKLGELRRAAAQAGLDEDVINGALDEGDPRAAWLLELGELRQDEVLQPRDLLGPDAVQHRGGPRPIPDAQARPQLVVPVAVTLHAPAGSARGIRACVTAAGW